jgi:ferredoxin
MGRSWRGSLSNQGGKSHPEDIMKIIVDYDLCEANARCMQVCPEIFEVDDDDNLILHAETFDESLKAKVEEAVRVCPRQAISIAKT